MSTVVWTVSVLVAFSLILADVRIADARAAGRMPPDGEALYQAHCSTCHGASGRGDGPDAPLFMPPPRNLRERMLELHGMDELMRWIRDGETLRLTVDPTAMRDRTRQVDQLVAHLHRLPEIRWDLVERGNEIYVERCEICHGPYGHGPVVAAGVQRPPRDLSDPAFQRDVKDRELEQVIRHGRRSMPAIAAMRNARDASAVIAFVRVLSPGFELYSRYCAACHGDDGNPANGTAPASERPSTVFNARYLSRQDPEELQKNVWHMLSQREPQMPHLRSKLDPAATRAIIEYLKRGEP